MHQIGPVSRRAGLCLILLLWAAGSILSAQALPEQVQELLEPPPGEGEPAAAEEQPEAGTPEEEPKEGLEDRLRIEGPITSAETWRKLGEELSQSFVAFLPNLLKALLVLVLVYFLYRLVHRVLDGVLRRTRADPGARSITLRLARWTVLVLGLILAASQLGFQVTSLLTGLGILGLVVGLAAQDSLANLIAGLIILFDRPFRVGDNVTIADTFGQVKEIGLRSTRILTVEQLDAMLPNKEVINQKIVNHTLYPQLRLGVPVGIAYKEDTRKARQVLLDKITGHSLIQEKPEPRVVVLALGESSVDLEIRVWLRDPHAEREALYELTELAKIALDEAGIEIPFPQRTLHVGSGRFPIEVFQAAADADSD